MSASLASLSDAQRDLLRGPLAVQVASADARLRPQVCRGWGIELATDEVLSTVLIDAQSRVLQEILRQSGKASVNATNPMTMTSLQFKGDVVELAEPDVDARQVLLARLEQFKQAVTQMGFAVESMGGLALAGPARRLVIRVSSIFVQTPGPGAGKPLGDS